MGPAPLVDWSDPASPAGRRVDGREPSQPSMALQTVLVISRLTT